MHTGNAAVAREHGVPGLDGVLREAGTVALEQFPEVVHEHLSNRRAVVEQPSLCGDEDPLTALSCAATATAIASDRRDTSSVSVEPERGDGRDVCLREERLQEVRVTFDAVKVIHALITPSGCATIALVQAARRSFADRPRGSRASRLAAVSARSSVAASVTPPPPDRSQNLAFVGERSDPRGAVDEHDAYVQRTEEVTSSSRVKPGVTTLPASIARIETFSRNCGMTGGCLAGRSVSLVLEARRFPGSRRASAD